MPTNPLEWAGAIVTGFAGCIVGFALWSVLGFLALFGLPLLFILVLHESLGALFRRNKPQVTNTKEQWGMPSWFWQPFVAGVIAGAALRLVEGGSV